MSVLLLYVEYCKFWERLPHSGVETHPEREAQSSRDSCGEGDEPGEGECPVRGQDEERSGGLGPHGHHHGQAEDGVQGDGEGPAGFRVLNRAGTGAGLQLLRQLVDLPLSLGVHRELILHGDTGQLLPHVPDLGPQVELVVCDGAGEPEEECDQGRDQLRAGRQEAAPQQQIHYDNSTLKIQKIRQLFITWSLGLIDD